jgi:hypothetical protein
MLIKSLVRSPVSLNIISTRISPGTAAGYGCTGITDLKAKRYQIPPHTFNMGEPVQKTVRYFNDKSRKKNISFDYDLRDSGDCHGWIRLYCSAHNDTLRVIDYACNQNKDKVIRAGQKE